MVNARSPVDDQYGKEDVPGVHPADDGEHREGAVGFAGLDFETKLDGTGVLPFSMMPVSLISGCETPCHWNRNSPNRQSSL